MSDTDRLAALLREVERLRDAALRNWPPTDRGVTLLDEERLARCSDLPGPCKGHEGFYHTADEARRSDIADGRAVGLGPGQSLCRCGMSAYQPDSVTGRRAAKRCSGCHRTIGNCICAFREDSDD